MRESTFDDILYGKLKMHQPLHGPRISVDTILLSWFAKLKNDDNVIELGTASGAVALILAKRWPHVPVIRAIDIQEDLIKMAKENAAINGLSDRVVFEVGDIRKYTLFTQPNPLTLLWLTHLITKFLEAGSVPNEIWPSRGKGSPARLKM